MHKKEIIFVYLPNTSHFMHFQSVRKKKGNIHNKTNKYRWYFWSKFHQTTSLSYAKENENLKYMLVIVKQFNRKAKFLGALRRKN